MASGQAIADPGEIRQFAQELRRFNEELKQSKARIQGRYNRLGETWRDRKHARFTREFEQMMRAIQKFLQVSEPQVPFLQEEARRIEHYLQH